MAGLCEVGSIAPQKGKQQLNGKGRRTESKSTFVIYYSSQVKIQGALGLRLSVSQGSLYEPRPASAQHTAGRAPDEHGDSFAVRSAVRFARG